MKSRLSAACLLLSVFAYGCMATMPPSQEVPAASNDYEFDIEASRASVFESLLSVAQTLNLSVDVLEKDSGFIQFKNSAVSAEQLDRFCVYPFVKKGTNDPFDTFSNWNRRSSVGGAGSVSGTLSLNIVLTEASGSTHAKLHSTWVGGNRNESKQASSKGVLERELESTLRAKLGLPSKS